jgi:hypothetical protein
MARKTSPLSPAERLRLAVQDLSSEMAVIRVARTAEILTADGTAAYRAYSEVLDPQALLLHLVEQAVSRRRKLRSGSEMGRSFRKTASRRVPPPSPAVDGPLVLRCTVPSGFGETATSVALRIEPNLSLTVHDAQGGEFLGAGELTEDGIVWSPCPMALCTLAREMLDTYSEGVGRVFGDGLIKVQDWTNERRARLLFGLGS